MLLCGWVGTLHGFWGDSWQWFEVGRGGAEMIVAQGGNRLGLLHYHHTARYDLIWVEVHVVSSKERAVMVFEIRIDQEDWHYTSESRCFRITKHCLEWAITPSANSKWNQPSSHIRNVTLPRLEKNQWLAHTSILKLASLNFCIVWQAIQGPALDEMVSIATFTFDRDGQRWKLSDRFKRTSGI